MGVSKARRSQLPTHHSEMDLRLLPSSTPDDMLHLAITATAIVLAVVLLAIFRARRNAARDIKVSLSSSQDLRCVEWCVHPMVCNEDRSKCIAPIDPTNPTPPWSKLKPETWPTRAWLQGFISAGGHLPQDDFKRLWGDDGLRMKPDPRIPPLREVSSSDYAIAAGKTYPPTCPIHHIKMIHLGNWNYACGSCHPSILHSEPACEHGTAWDVHCCNCHSGFIFDLDHECPEPDNVM